MLETFFSVYEFSNREIITFSLLKVTPHVKDWWETYCEQNNDRESSLFLAAPTWNYFLATIREQYYPFERYEDKYI
ncbi:hypothetical protein, partial [Actinobacillus pleuropneumoniae]|uniref:hypothetical protein n=1 Tax=Actinobacillus pleuropneumoniae TaxID=715 RepID=UPI00227CBEA1